MVWWTWNQPDSMWKHHWHQDECLDQPKSWRNAYRGLPSNFFPSMQGILQLDFFQFCQRNGLSRLLRQEPRLRQEGNTRIGCFPWRENSWKCKPAKYPPNCQNCIRGFICLQHIASHVKHQRSAACQYSKRQIDKNISSYSSYWCQYANKHQFVSVVRHSPQ